LSATNLPDGHAGVFVVFMGCESNGSRRAAQLASGSGALGARLRSIGRAGRLDSARRATLA